MYTRVFKILVFHFNFFKFISNRCSFLFYYCIKKNAIRASIATINTVQLKLFVWIVRKEKETASWVRLLRAATAIVYLCIYLILSPIKAQLDVCPVLLPIKVSVLPSKGRNMYVDRSCGWVGTTKGSLDGDFSVRDGRVEERSRSRNVVVAY